MTVPHDAVSHYPPIPAADMERLHADDRRAGAIVIAVMTAIFTIGLILYSVIFFSIL
jgi:hypothetical protein